jgi:hypothetical protein
MNNTRVLPLFNERIRYFETAFAQIVVWQLLHPLRGSRHRYKYRLAYVVNETCVLRYDNESGKGDHRHYGDNRNEIMYLQSWRSYWPTLQQILARWNRENNLV